ncbi:hypothetical protein NQZ79_g5877 [Umbelopsis isabellina]|nr:hypothetical protein NQZ79_g5877 [Umbelopsis isabellina]
MDLTQFFSRYTTFISQIRVPPVMAQHGLTLLQRCVYLEHCDATNLRLLPGVVHLDPRQRRCENMVYFLLKRPGGNVEYRALDNNVLVSGDTMVYAGQTGNFVVRERVRTGIMRNSTIILCFGHDLTQYQQDCLELAAIIFSFLVFGLRTRNVSPYPKYVYHNIPASISIDRAEDHAALQRTNTYQLLRHTVFVGTAPSVRIMNLQWYIDSLQNATNPIFNWDLVALASPSLARLLAFLTNGDDSIVAPPFIDHFPDISSEKYDDLSLHLTGTSQREYDRQVRDTAHHMNSRVIVMFGGRPTQLIDTVHRNRFLATICSRVDLNYISLQTCSFIMWWPHFGIEHHASSVTKVRLSQVWLLLSLKLNLLLWRLESESFGENGLDHVTAQSVVEWLAGLPLSQQLSRLLVEVSVNWMSTDAGTLTEFTELSTEIIGSNNTPPAVADPFFLGIPSIQDQASIENEASTSVASVVQPNIGEASTSAAIELQPDIGEANVIMEITEDNVVDVSVLPNTEQDHLDAHFQGWARWTETQAMNRTMQRVPNFLVLPRTEQLRELTRTAQTWSATVRQTRLSKSIEAGHFVPRDGETNEEQLARFQRQINMERVRRNHVPGAELLTCVYCNQLIHKTLPSNGKVHVPTQPENCPNPPSLKVGWSIVRGEYDGIFPDENIFALFARAQVPGTVLNQVQLGQRVAIFCHDNDWHPQVQHLMDLRYYRNWGRVMAMYAAGEEPGSVKSGWITGVKEALGKVARTEPVVIIKRQKTRPEGYKQSHTESTNTMSVYAFRPASNNRDDILSLEQP